MSDKEEASNKEVLIRIAGLVVLAVIIICIVTWIGTTDWISMTWTPEPVSAYHSK